MKLETGSLAICEEPKAPQTQTEGSRGGIPPIIDAPATYHFGDEVPNIVTVLMDRPATPADDDPEFYRYISDREMSSRLFWSFDLDPITNPAAFSKLAQVIEEVAGEFGLFDSVDKPVDPIRKAQFMRRVKEAGLIKKPRKVGLRKWFSEMPTIPGIIDAIKSPHKKTTV